MLRWLVRLLIVGAIVGVAAFVAQRFLNQDDDFDDFDDLDDTFEFQETPVEIEVPASDAGGSTMSGAPSAYSGGGQDDGMGRGAGGGEGDQSEEGPTGPGLIDVKGIGSAFASRLNAVGINTLEDLASASAETLNEQLDVPGGVGTLEDWIGQARELASSGSSSSNGVSDQ